MHNPFTPLERERIRVQNAEGESWITVGHTHIPVEKGESKKEAIKEKIPEAVDKSKKTDKPKEKGKSDSKSKSKESRTFKKGDKVSMDGQEGTIQFAEGIEEDGYPVYHVKWKDGSRSSEASKHYKKV